MSHTGNPRAPKPEDVGIAQEPTGPVAADSLAAESLQDGSGFSKNTNAHALGVKGAQSTLNTTDTSGATALPPATDAEEREKQDALGQGSDVKGVTGLKYPEGAGKAEFEGHHSATGGYSGGPSSTSTQTGSGGGQSGSAGAPTGASDFGASTISSSTGGLDESQIRSGEAAIKGASSSSAGDTTSGGSGGSTGTGGTTTGSSGGSGDKSGSGPAAGTGVRPHVDSAPNYVGAVTGQTVSDNNFKPKGKNLEDADQTDSIPQTKTFVGAVGTVNVGFLRFHVVFFLFREVQANKYFQDPGRLAERDFEGQNNEPVGDLGQVGEEGGSGGQQGGDKGQFGVLESERA